MISKGVLDMKQYVKLLIVLNLIFSILLINSFANFGFQLSRLGEHESNAAVAAPQNISLIFNGRKIDVEEKLLGDNEVIMVPVRTMSTDMGANIIWDEYYRKTTISYKETYVQFFPDSKFAIVNGSRKNMNVQVRIMDGRMYVPLAFVADIYGATIKLEEKTNTVYAEEVGVISNNEMGILVKGDKTFVDHTLKSLKIMFDNSRENFEIVHKYVGKIEQGDKSGMAAYEEPPTFYVGNPTSNASTTWYASAIAHDSFHSKLYHDYEDIHGTVPNEVWGGYEPEMRCLEYQIGVLERVGASQSEVEYAKSLRGTNWWDGAVTW